MSSPSDKRRVDGRKDLELRKLRIVPAFNPYADGSAEVFLGITRLLVTASLFKDASADRRVEMSVSMLPRSTHIRDRSEEILRAERRELEMIRSLSIHAMEAAVADADLRDLVVSLECSVICADGGVAGATIAGGWVALYQALQFAAEQGEIDDDLEVIRMVAISAGIVEDCPMLDLLASESMAASFRTVVVFNSHKQLVKMQADQEESAADLSQLQELLNAASVAIEPILKEQEKAALALG